MFEPLLGFTDPNCTGHTDKHFLHENPQFLISAKGTTKKAEALELFVYIPIQFTNNESVQKNKRRERIGVTFV